MLRNEPNIGDAVRFLKWLRPAGPWVVTAISPDKRGLNTKTFDASTVDDLMGWLNHHNGVDNCYVMVNPPRRHLDKKASKEDVEALELLYVDCDPPKGVDLTKAQPEILDRLQAFKPKPHAIVFSGGGYQAFWRLNEPVFVGGNIPMAEELEAYNQQLELVLKGDHCHNIDRIMRIPGTWNMPDEKKRKAGRVEALARIVGELSDEALPLDQFTPAPRSSATPSAGLSAPRVQISGNLAPVHIDDLPETVPLRIKMLIVQGNDPDEPTKYASRSEVSWAVTCGLLRAGCDDNTVASILLDPDYAASSHCRDQPRPMDYVERQLSRAHEKICSDPNLLSSTVIVWSEPEIGRCLDETQAALIATRAPIYQMGGSLVHPVRGQTQPTSTFENPRSSGRLSANPIGKHRLREYFLSAAAYVKIVSDDGKPKKVPFNPPLSFAEHLLGRGDAWTFPVLTGIVTSPTLRSDGSVVAKDGYDAQSGLIVDLQGMDFPPVPAIPSWDEARSALDALAQTLSEFPFVADEDGDSPSGTRPSQSRSVALAMLITAVARPAFRTAPIFGISAPTMATGKSLLADIPALILTGRSATKMSQGATQEEDEKRLLAVLLQGDQVVVIDNVARPIRGDAICTILTEDSWRCRMLGRSEMREVQTRTLFIATGNNLAFHEDISSRAILVSLDAETERPDERTFRCDVRSYVPANRMTLAAAALTVLRAYIAAGRPPIEGMKPSRFTEWDVVRAALIWLGEPDPWGTNAKVSSNDGTRTDHVDLMVSIKDVFGIGKWLSATQIIDASKTDDPAAKQLDAALNAIYPRSACLIPDRRLPSATEGLLNVWNVGGSRHATTMRLAL